MYFHVSHHDWNVWDIVQQGMWGRLTKRFGLEHHPQGRDVDTLLWEMAFETARQAATPNLPSRFDITFLWGTLARAEHFRTSHRPGARIYEMQPFGEPRQPFTGDFGLIAAVGQTPAPFVDYMIPIALQYWNPTAEPADPEILYPGPLEIIAEHP